MHPGLEIARQAFDKTYAQTRQRLKEPRVSARISDSHIGIANVARLTELGNLLLRHTQELTIHIVVVLSQATGGMTNTAWGF
jgi:hypothetical protein